jgi:serine/threonine protein phosphatase PrpC
VLLTRSLPRPDSFGALLAGTWADGRWEGEVAPAPTLEVASCADLEVATEYVIESAAASDTGMVREQNQDNFMLSDGNRLWAVADGMGGHSHGEVASQMVVDALNALEPTASLNACLQSVSVALQRVNADLRREALGMGSGGRSGSTVVALAIRANEWGVSWAGDSRAYVFRASTLAQLTRDHSAVNEESTDGTAGEITRAVGGHDELELENAVNSIESGDRFLLCSDGLYVALDEAALSGCLRRTTPREAVQALIDAAREAGARDNITAVVVDVKE